MRYEHCEYNILLYIIILEYVEYVGIGKMNFSNTNVFFAGMQMSGDYYYMILCYIPTCQRACQLSIKSHFIGEMQIKTKI